MVVSNGDPLWPESEPIDTMEQLKTVTLSRSHWTLVRKALQRYRMRIEEVGALGWYDNPEVTRQELARVDAILAVLEE